MNHVGIFDTSFSLQGAIPQDVLPWPSLFLLGEAIFQKAIKPQPHSTLPVKHPFLSPKPNSYHHFCGK